MSCASEEELETKWYAVKATYKAVSLGVDKRRHLWERLIFLIQAPVTEFLNTHDAALLKAEEIARGKEHEYEASNGSTCRWVFQEIEAVLLLADEEFVDGVEVFWEHFRRVDQLQPTPSAVQQEHSVPQRGGQAHSEAP